MIVPMVKVTFIGLEAEKERFFQYLQKIGVVHLVFSHDSVAPVELLKDLARVIETRKALTSRAGEGKQKNLLSAREICEKRESLNQREARLQAETVALKKEISVLEAWGDFSVEEIDALRERGVYIQFFRVPQRNFQTLPLQDVYHQVVSVTRGETCFITVSNKPVSLQVSEEKLPSRSISGIRMELRNRDAELKEIEAECADLACHLETLKKEETSLTNLLEYRRAALNAQSELEKRLFVVECWSPVPEKELVSKIPSEFSLYHYSEQPSEEDRVPVLLRNRPAFESGEDLVKIYSYPSYKDFDPSGFVLYCFAVFFGMIVGDAGYGLVLLAITVFLHWKIKRSSPVAVRFLRLMYFLSAFVIFYGIISGGYFGMFLSAENPLSAICLIDFNTKEGQNLGMLLSIIIGMIHISLSFLIKFRNTRDFAALGWIGAIWSGYFLVHSEMADGVNNPAAMYALIASLAVVFIFSSRSKNLLFRILEGLNGLLGIVQVFSDVLSYLRLFALGIATVYMAHTFNMLAEEIAAALPWIGYVFASIILFAGHSVNLLLGVMGGVIHGLRLNFLEWYRWSFSGDGIVYKPFRLVET